MISGEAEIKKVISDFDLLKIDEVRSMHLEFSYEEIAVKRQLTDVCITFTYPYNGATYIITLKLFGVRKLSLPEIGTSMFELGELYIYPIEDRNIPDVNYSIEDHLDGMTCFCREVSFTKMHKLESDGSLSFLWGSNEVSHPSA